MDRGPDSFETALKPDNNVVPSFDGKYLAYWRGRVVFDTAGLRIKRFKSERDARDYLALCDALGRLA
jgi:hypothetical protein